MRSFGFILIALLSVQAGAASISKCVDAQGNVTFTKNANCPEATALQGHVEARNQRISSDGETVRLAEPKAYQPHTAQRPQVIVKEVPVVVEREPEEVDTYRGPKRTDRKVRTMNSPQQRVEMREVNIRSTHRTKDGRTVGRSERVKIPIIR